MRQPWGGVGRWTHWSRPARPTGLPQHRVAGRPACLDAGSDGVAARAVAARSAVTARLRRRHPPGARPPSPRCRASRRPRSPSVPPSQSWSGSSRRRCRTALGWSSPGTSSPRCCSPSGFTGPAELIAVSAAQSADGRLADLDGMLRAAQAAGARTLIDTTQSCGWLPLDGSAFDYLVCGAYKWRLSPRGTAATSSSRWRRSPADRTLRNQQHRGAVNSAMSTGKNGCRAASGRRSRRPPTARTSRRPAR